jgi:hypothetical protein
LMENEQATVITLHSVRPWQYCCCLKFLEHLVGTCPEADVFIHLNRPYIPSHYHEGEMLQASILGKPLSLFHEVTANA